MTGILVRACKALAVAPQNRRYILDAGGLDLLLDALCSGPEELSLQALQVRPPGCSCSITRCRWLLTDMAAVWWRGEC